MLYTFGKIPKILKITPILLKMLKFMQIQLILLKIDQNLIKIIHINWLKFI